MHLAVSYAQLEVVQLLLASDDCRGNLDDNNGNTALSFCISADKHAFVRALLDSDVDVRHDDATFADADIARMLIERETRSVRVKNRKYFFVSFLYVKKR